MRLKMSEKSRKEMLLAVRPQYQQAGLKEKKQILDGFVQASGYNRKHAVTLLNTRIVEKDRRERNRTQKYDAEVQQALISVWKAANKICSKRLIPFLPTLIPQMEKFGHLNLPATVREKLMGLSPATADRLLRQERQRQGKGKSTTRPGSLIKKQVAVRTFADWDDVVPGFLEADCVAHCGEVAKGQFLNTLTMTDIATGWTELVPLLTRTGTNVIEALSETKSLLPFSLLGFDSDNGGEFINEQVFDWCIENEVTFTRSREYRKNDQAHVEEKNGSIVRRYVGYDRFEGFESWKVLSTLYRILRLFINFLQPSLQLQSKERDGGRVRKRYAKAKTPYQRVLDSKAVSEEVKVSLRKLFEKLDPVLLLEEIERMQQELWQTATTSNISQLRLLATKRSENPFEETAQSDCPSPRMTRRKNGKAKRDTTAKTSVKEARERTDLSAVWDYVVVELSKVPGMSANQILTLLMKKFPGQFGKKDQNAIGARLSRWRKENGITLKSLGLATWTRSPVNAVWSEVCLELDKNPLLSAGEILSMLSERYPGQFRSTHRSSIGDKLRQRRTKQVKQKLQKQNTKQLAPDWSADRVIDWANKIGPATTHLVNTILQKSDCSYPGIRSCLGLLSLEQKYGADRLESAAVRATSLKSWTIKIISSMLKEGSDRTYEQLVVPF